MKSYQIIAGVFAVAIFSLTGVIAQGAESAAKPAASGNTPIEITIKNHAFTPSEIHLPANQKTEITVKNLDPTAEEFESPGLKVEKVVAGNSEITVRVRPARKGRYTFVGEYHEKTARGQAVVE